MAYSVIIRKIELKPKFDCTTQGIQSLFQTQNDLSNLEVENERPPMAQMLEKMLRTPNIELTVKNRDTLTQFAATAYLDPDYLAKA